jgi:hypothetical protein
MDTLIQGQPLCISPCAVDQVREFRALYTLRSQILVQTVSLLLAHRAISPNGIHPPGSGTTPLHLAASLGRLDIVTVLLEQENIDDSLRDSHGRTCRDVARGKDVIRAIDGVWSFLSCARLNLIYFRFTPFSQCILSVSSTKLHPLATQRPSFTCPDTPSRVTADQICRPFIPRRRHGYFTPSRSSQTERSPPD